MTGQTEQGPVNRVIDTLDEKVLTSQDDSAAVWRLVVLENLKTKQTHSEWRPYIVDLEGNVVQEPYWMPLPGSQSIFLQSPVFETLFAGTRGPGKMQPLDEPVLTPYGWKPMGELKVGQSVMTPAGSKAKITHVFPHKNRAIYRVTFDDGSSTRVGDEHLWKFKVTGHRRKAGRENWNIHDTMEMKRHLDAGRAVLIPTVEPQRLQRPRRLKDWPIDPYLLGLWLGDGHVHSVRKKNGTIRVVNVGFTSIDGPLWEYVKQFGFMRYDHQHHRLNKRDDLSGFRSALVRLKLADKKSWNKFIPELYKWGCVEDRTALLQGLMDTDGTVDKRGYVTFCSASEDLAKGVQYLAWSLGAKASITKKASNLNGKAYRPSYEVYMQPAGKFEPFRLTRKQDRVNGYMHDYVCRRVTSIEYVDHMDAACIAINDLDKLYVTKDFIVTHNTLTLLMDFARGVGQGYGSSWRGILFRRHFGDLDDVVRKVEEWYGLLFPGFRFLKSKSEYKAEWPSGEALLLRHMRNEEDYSEYHGHEYPWIGWEELTQWEDDKAYRKMFSCCRPPRPGVPCRIRSTTNPYGPGHIWVKRRFQLPENFGRIIREPNARERVAIHGDLKENFLLMHSEPHYATNIMQAASNPAEAKAWLEGDWNVTAGGMFDDLWQPRVHIVPNIPTKRIPQGWHLSRAYDHGQSHPFAVGWWLESNGEPIEVEGRLLGSVRGDLILWKEWYGTSGGEQDGVRMPARLIARGILDRDEDEDVLGRVVPGPADTEIWSRDSRGTSLSPADDMEDEGVIWERADKTPGSRKRGWEMLRNYLQNAIPADDGTRERPGLFVCQRCRHWIEIVPPTPRDPQDMDEIPKKYADHLGDMTRYRITWDRPETWQREFH